MEITLFRGLRNRSEKELIEKNRTAGGKTVNPSPTAPSDNDMRQYESKKATAGECYPPKPDQEIITEFTEYTTDLEIAKSFGRRSGFVVQITVDTYLVKAFPNDQLEHGVLVRSDTPLIELEILSV